MWETPPMATTAPHQRRKPGPLSGPTAPHKSKDQARVARLAGMSQEQVCIQFGVKLATLRTWEFREAWATPEKIRIEAEKLRTEQRKAGSNIEAGLVLQGTGGIESKIETTRQKGLELIQFRAKQLVEIGETTAFGVAEHVAKLIKSSIRDDSIPAPDSLESLATAFKMVERATGREAKNQAVASVTVQLSPYTSGIVGELKPTTITLEAGDSPVETPNWLSVSSDADDGS